MNPFLFRRVRGPVFLLTFAVTALLSQWHLLSFGRSWPLYLLAAGGLNLLEALIPVRLPFGYNPSALPYRRTVTSAVVPLAVGAVALLITTGAVNGFRFADGFARWWPLALIVIGVLLLLERIFERGRYAGATAPRRRGGVGGWLVLLLLLGLGVSANGHLRPHEDWHWGDNNFEWDWGGALDGEAHENTVTLEENIAPRVALTVDNARGDVLLSPSADGRIHVRAVETAHVPDNEKDRAFAAVRPRLEVHGDEATLTVPGREHVEVRLEIALPPGVAPTIRTHHGDVSASGLDGALAVNSDHGDAALENLRGPVRLTMDHGDLRARSLMGDLEVDGRADDVSVAGIRGRTMLHGAFFGDTEISDASGAVSFRSDRTTLEIPMLKGTLTLDNDDLRVAGVPAGVDLQTRSKDVEITGLSGPATIEDSNSDVSVALAGAAGPLSVRNSTGNIVFSAPGDASFTLNGVTGKEDEISSEFPFAQASDGGGKSIRGQQGQGGPHIDLKTEHGDLTLRRAGEKPPRRLRAEGDAPTPVAQ